MSIIRTIFLVATFAFAGAVCAQGCSCGTQGGMDATGNQCSQPELAALPATSPKVTVAESKVPSTRGVAARDVHPGSDAGETQRPIALAHVAHPRVRGAATESPTTANSTQRR